VFVETELVSRWRQESSSLYATQRDAWLTKLRQLGLDLPTGARATCALTDSISAGGLPAITDRDALVAAVPAVNVADPAITHKFYGRATALAHFTV